MPQKWTCFNLNSAGLATRCDIKQSVPENLPNSHADLMSAVPAEGHEQTSLLPLKPAASLRRNLATVCRVHGPPPLLFSKSHMQFRHVDK